MWEHYYGLAYSAAVKLKGGMGQDRGVTVGDLCQWAGLGLKDAIEKFDPGREVRFETYAWGRMRGAVGDGLRGWDILSRAGRREYRTAEGGSESRTAVMAFRLGSARRFSDIVPAEGRGNEPRNQVGAAGVGSGLDRSDEWEWLMRGLSRRDRLILILYYRERLTMKEIGVVIGRTESLVSQAVRCAKGLIRERVEGRF